MAKLSGKQIAQLQEAILDAFTPDQLRQFLLTSLDRDLSRISMGGNMTTVVFDVITEAERVGWTARLLEAVGEARPERKDLQPLLDDLLVVVQSPAQRSTDAHAVELPHGEGPEPAVPMTVAGPADHDEAMKSAASADDTELRRHLADGEVDAFAGAGMSVGAGLPDWYTLISELAGRAGQEMPPRQWAAGDALIDAAQTYVNRQGLHSLISHLKERLDTTGVQPTAAHRALARLPISLVFTANFDDLLERAYRDAGKRVEVVVRDSSIPFMRRAPGAVSIIKLYGDLDQPDTIVLARQQYERYFLERPQLVKLLEIELGRASMLYLGWSHSDPHFGLVFGQLLTQYKDFVRPGYAAMFDVPQARREELERKHIRVVEFPSRSDRTAQLAAWLESIGQTP